MKSPIRYIYVWTFMGKPTVSITRGQSIEAQRDYHGATRSSLRQLGFALSGMRDEYTIYPDLTGNVGYSAEPVKKFDPLAGWDSMEIADREEDSREEEGGRG